MIPTEGEGEREGGVVAVACDGLFFFLHGPGPLEEEEGEGCGPTMALG